MDQLLLYSGKLMYSCYICKKDFKGSWGNVNKFCSQECYWKSRKGCKLSEEHKRKLTGLKHTEETKEKISQGFLKVLKERGGAWWSSGMKGKKWSDQHRANIMKAIASKTPEKKRELSNKLSRLFRGRVVSEETKNKIRLARMNQKTANKTSKTELLLQGALSEEGIAFEVYKKVSLRTIPDLYIHPNICVYVDGCFWHKCPQHFDKVASLRPDSKVFQSINKAPVKDAEIDRQLVADGYVVLRFWEHDIQNNLNGCVTRVKEVVSSAAGGY